MKKYLLALLAFLVLVSPLSAEMVKQGKVLSWSTSAGQNGTLTILTVKGNYFEAAQKNSRNTSAGTVKLYGALVENGSKMVLINTGQWKEIWEGDISSNSVSGKLAAGSAKYTFKITDSVSVSTSSTEPFVKGKTLKWSTSAGQNGTFLVTGVSGAKFTIDQVNFRNKAAGTTKLEGEVKSGTIYIYNKKWNETWTGTYSNGKTTGKINNRYSFTITN